MCFVFVLTFDYFTSFNSSSKRYSVCGGGGLHVCVCMPYVDAHGELYVRMYMPTSMILYAFMCIHMCMHACVCAFVSVLHECVMEKWKMHAHTYTHTGTQVYIHLYVMKCIHTQLCFICSLLPPSHFTLMVANLYRTGHKHSKVLKDCFNYNTINGGAKR